MVSDMSGVTPDTAVRHHLDILVNASEQADVDGYSVLASDLHEAHEFFVALLSELATARQDLSGYRKTLDQADAKIFDLRAELATARQENEKLRDECDAWARQRNDAEAELVVVRRQLEEAREALRKIADEDTDIYSSRANRMRMVARAVLDAGQKQK